MSGYNKVYEMKKKIEVETDGFIKILEGCTTED